MIKIGVSTYPFIDRWHMQELYPFKKPRFKGNIDIGNDVWIASNVILLSGIKIGNGAIVGAGSVVTKDVPPYSIVAGNPIKLIKYRFSEFVIKDLLAIQWWNWDENVIKSRIADFTDTENFVNKYKVRG